MNSKMLIGVWKGNFQDSFGWNTRLNLEISEVNGELMGSLRTETFALRALDRGASIVQIKHEGDKIFFSGNLNGRELTAEGVLVDTGGFFGIGSMYGVTELFRLSKWGGGCWIVWKIEEPKEEKK